MRPPERIGRYRVQSVIGVGGFGVVVRALDEALDAPVAIKMLAENWVGDPEVRERFLEEARLLRRIRSDHLVTVHDVGELDGGQPYFVMEFAARGSLADRLAGHGSTGLDPASARKLVTALSEGLGALHRAGIVHRDVNPRNLFLQAQETGSVHGERGERAARSTQIRRGLIGAEERLLIGDLGLAKDVVRTGAAASVIGGTPRYQAPEQLDAGAPVRPAADVFAASAVLWAAITGTLPPKPADLDGAVSTVDERWRPLFERGLAADADERFADMSAWRDAALACLGPGLVDRKRGAVTRVTALASAGPYKGLAAFQSEDAARFFGRDALIGELLDRLGRERTLMVGGPSGSGKSSLVRAGLIPAVAAGGLAGSERWPVALFTPRDDPIGELAYQLAKTARSVTQQSSLAADADAVRRDPRHARFVAETVTDLTGGLLVVIDQFEELFTQTGSREEQTSFLDLLAAVVDPADSRVRLVMAMRADFYGTSALFPWLAHRITQNQVLVGPMERGELRQAIEEPARQAGLRLEDGLVEAVLDDGGSEPGALPLVSHALAETWRRRRGNALTVAAYRQAGGVAGAIAQTADAVYQNQLDDDQRRAARRLLLRLVTPGEGTPDTRRRLPLDDLDNDSEPVHMTAVAGELTDARLLTVDRDAIEIAHEALIHSWPRLRGWIEESRDDLRVRQRVDRAGQEWVAQGREPDLLYRGTPLQSALEWAARHGGELTPAGRELLEASEAAWIEAQELRRQAENRSRRLRRAAISVLSVLTVVAIGASVVAFSALGQATSRLAQSLATQAVALVEEDPRLALALGVEAIARGDEPSPEARTALVDGSRELAAAAFAPAGSEMLVGDALSVAVRPDGAVAATGNRDGSLRLWDTASRQALGAPLEGHQGAVEELAFSPDGRWLVSAGGDDATVRRWDVGDPASVPAPTTLGTTGGIVWAVAVSPDGRTVASASEDGTIRLWDLAGAAQIGEPVTDMNTDLLAVAFHPDGTVLLAADGRGQLWGWSLPEREQVLGPLQVHRSDVWEIQFDASGEVFATASSDGRVRVWDTATGDPSAEPFVGTAADVRGINLSPGGMLLAGDEEGRVRTWNLAEEAEGPATAAGHGAQTIDAALSADGDVFVTLAFDHTLHVWARGQVPTAAVLDGHDDGAFGVAVSPAGDLVATGDGAGAVRVFDAATGDLVVGPLATGGAEVWGLDFSSDGRLLASGSGDGSVRVHDVESGAVVARPTGHGGAVSVVRFAGTQLVSGGDDGAVRAWGSSGEAVGDPLGGHAGGVTDMVLGPEGTLAVADRQGRLRLWDLDARALRGGEVTADDNTVWGLAWSPDGRFMATASADEVVTVWDAARRAPLADLTPHPGGATGAAFLGDGATLVTTARDGAVRLWDVPAGRPIGAPLVAHGGPVWRVVAHPDKARFVTSSEDGTVRVWDVLDVERACERAAGAFDDERRRRYLGPDEAAAGCRSER